MAFYSFTEKAKTVLQLNGARIPVQRRIPPLCSIPLQQGEYIYVSVEWRAESGERRAESGGWRAENWLFGSHFSREGAPKTVEIRKIGI